MPTPDRWEPDLHLLDSARQGNLSMVNLSPPDRAWIVAGLMTGGLTAEEVADRLDCSLRLIRTVRAEPMTQVAVYAMRQAVEADRVVRGLHQRVRGLETEAVAHVARYDDMRTQRDRLIDERCRRG